MNKISLATPPEPAAVTPDQMALITRTVAKDATADELKLYLFDCARQGVHPLDRLVHFTKRNGKYTPITSIDFMRVRAADTGEYAGSDDAVFASDPNTGTKVVTADINSVFAGFAATVTVWRLVQGQRCAFTATARWWRYKPEANDFMWKRMPHTMLAKCAEALALRKGFPRQLSGLYAKEELDQADTEGLQPVPVTVEAPPPEPPTPTLAAAVAAVAARVETRDEWRGVLVESVTERPTKNASVTKYWVKFNNGHDASTIREVVATLAKHARDECTPVNVKTEHGKYGLEILELFVA